MYLQCKRYQPTGYLVAVSFVRSTVNTAGLMCKSLIPFTTLYCYNSSILLLVIAVILLLWLIYKQNFSVGVYVEGKHSVYRVRYYPWFQASAGGLGTYSPHISRDYCTLRTGNMAGLENFSMAGAQNAKWRDIVKKTEEVSGGQIMKGSIFMPS